MGAFGIIVTVTPRPLLGDDSHTQLSLTVDRAGTARLSVPAPLIQVVSRSAIATSFGCQLPTTGDQAADISFDCSGLFKRRAWVVSGGLELERVAAILRGNDVSSVRLKVSHPHASFTRCVPGARDRWASDNEIRYVYDLDLENPLEPSRLTLQFGYRGGDLAVFGCVLTAILLAPIAATILFERRVRSSYQSDPQAGTAEYHRFVGQGRIAMWIVWCLTLLILRFQDLVAFVTGPATAPAGALVVVSAFLLPPIFSLAVCEAAFAPLSTRLRGSDWTRSDLYRQSLWRQSSLLVPLGLLVTGALSVDLGRPLAWSPWLAAAVLTRAESQRRLSLAWGFIPRELSTGDLRDRAFALAAKARAPLRHLYLLPGEKGRLANAFVGPGATVFLTDYLLRHVSRSEADAILAHELAHLRRRDAVFFTAKWGVVWAALAAAALGAAALLESVAPFVAVPIFAALAVAAFRRRRESAADLQATALTGDPESLIRGLARIDLLNTQPLLRRRDDFVSHPSTHRRAEAIAAAHGIPAARLAELLEPREPVEPYAIPAGTLSNRVFKTAERHRVSMRFGWLVLLSTILPPALAALIAVRVEAAAVWAFYAAGFLTAVGALLIVDNVAPVWRYDQWRQELAKKAGVEGVDVSEPGWMFVAHSPDDQPRIYDTNGDWDLGFLLIAADRLVYWGEQARFALRHDQVVSIHLGPGIPAAWRSARVYVRWRDEQGLLRTVNFRPAAARSLRQTQPLARDLASRLTDFVEGGGLQRQFSETLSALPAPDHREVTSSEPGAEPAGLLVRGLAWTALLAAAVSECLSLPWGALRPGDQTAFVPSPGWYVVAVASLLAIFQWLPSLLARRRASQSHAARVS